MEKENLENIRQEREINAERGENNAQTASVNDELESIERETESKRETMSVEDSDRNGIENRRDEVSEKETREKPVRNETDEEIDRVVVSAEEKQMEKQLSSLNQDQILFLSNSLGIPKIEEGEDENKEKKEKRRLLKIKLMEMPPEDAKKTIEEARAFKSSYKFKQILGGVISAEVLTSVFLQSVETQTPYDFKQDWDSILKENQRVKKFLSKISSEKDKVAQLDKIMRDKEYFNPDYLEIKKIWVCDSASGEFKQADLEGLKSVEFPTPSGEPANKHQITKESAWLTKLFRQQGLEQIEAGLLKAGEDYDYQVPDIEPEKNEISVKFLNASRILRKYCGTSVKNPQMVVKSIFTISDSLLNLDDREAVNDFLTSLNELIDLMSNMTYRLKLQSYEDYLEDLKEYYSQENFELQLTNYAEFSDMLETKEKDASASPSYQEEKLAIANDVVENEDLLKDELSKLRLKLLGAKTTELKEATNTDVSSQPEQSSTENVEKYLSDTTEISRKTAEALAYEWAREAIINISKEEYSLSRAVSSKKDYLSQLGAESDFNKIMATFTKQEVLHKSIFAFSNLATVFDEKDKQAVVEIEDDAIEANITAKHKEVIERMLAVIRRSAFSPNGQRYTDELVMKSMLDMCVYSGKFMILDANTKSDMGDFGFELSCIEDKLKSIQKTAPEQLINVKRALNIDSNADYPYYKDWVVRAFTIESQEKKETEKSEQKKKDSEKNKKQGYLDTCKKLLAIQEDISFSEEEKKSKLTAILQPITEDDLIKIIDGYAMTGSIFGDSSEKKNQLQSRILKLDSEQMASLEASWVKLEQQAEEQEKQDEAGPTYKLFQNDPYLRDITGNALTDDSGTPYMKMDLFNSNEEIMVNPATKSVIVRKAANYDERLHGAPEDYESKNDASSITLTNYGELAPEQQSEFKMQFAPEAFAEIGMPREAEMYLTDINNFSIAKYISTGIFEKVKKYLISKEKAQKTEEERQEEIMNDSFSLCDSSKQPIKNKSGYTYSINDLKFRQFTYYIDKKKKSMEESGQNSSATSE